MLVGQNPSRRELFNSRRPVNIADGNYLTPLGRYSDQRELFEITAWPAVNNSLSSQFLSTEQPLPPTHHRATRPPPEDSRPPAAGSSAPADRSPPAPSARAALRAHPSSSPAAGQGSRGLPRLPC
jgi:hypothetical protein